MFPKLNRALHNNIAAAALLCAAAVPVGALAQAPEAAANERGALEEITVTATRRGEVDIRTTPVAVSAIDEAAVEALSPRDLGDIAALVPNFSAGKPAGFNAASFAMRGVGQTSIIVYADAHVGVTVDDFVIPHIQTQVLEMFDIDQIEVLRGPQGTLFGKNTTGGVVNVRTKRPDLDSWEAELQAKFASFGRNEERFAINVPLISQRFAVRASGVFIDSDGFWKNNAMYGPAFSLDRDEGEIPPLDGMSGRGNGESLGGDDVFSGRFKAAWQPNDDFYALLTYEMIRDDSDSPPVYNGTPAGSAWVFNALGFGSDNADDPLEAAGISMRDDLLLNMSRGHRVDVDGYYLNLEWNLGDYTLYGVAGRREQESRLPSTYVGEIVGSLFDATRDDNRETTQLELRVASDFGGPFDFVTGVFAQDDETDFCVLQVLGFLDFFPLPAGDPPNGVFFNNVPQVLCNQQDASNWALFADITYSVNERFNLGAGVRYTDEEKKWRGRHQVPIIPGDTFGAGNFSWRDLGSPLAAGDFNRYPFGVISHQQDWGEATWRLTASYDFSDELFAYFTYSRGFKSGAYNDQTGTTGLPFTERTAAPTDPETADSYELGAKMDLLDGRMRLDLIGFYVLYDDAQRDLVASFTNAQGATFQETRFFNAAEVTAYGIEAETSVLLTDNFTAKANVGWLNSEYDKFEADTDFDGMTDINLSDRDVNRAPEFQGGIDLIYDQPFQAGNLQFLFNTNYEDESIFVYSGNDAAPDANGITDSRTLVNAAVTWNDSEDRYFARVFGRNLSDERYRVGELPVANLWVMSYYGEPRTVGVEFGFKFSGE